MFRILGNLFLVLAIAFITIAWSSASRTGQEAALIAARDSSVQTGLPLLTPGLGDPAFNYLATR